MTLVELKKTIHQKIDDSNDRELLEMIDALLTEKNKIFLKSILIGYIQSANGLTKPHVKVMQEFIDKYK